MNKMQYILGTATIVVIAGGTIYAIKKSKDMKKSEESEISLAEARAVVEERRLAQMNEVAEEFSEMVDEIRETADWNRSFMPHDVEDEEWVDIEEIKDEIRATATVISDMRKDVEDNEDVINDGAFCMDDDTENEEEDGDELRYEPNSVEAKNQYIKMELAEWRPLEDTYQTMVKLFEFPFNPENDGDHMMMTQIIDYRVQFFGFNSRWVKEVTIADVILHYARAAEFDCGENVRYWVEYFLEFNNLDFRMSSHQLDEVIGLLNSHTYFNEDRQTFGLFGLTRESMDQAIRIANRNIDQSLTYEIEFNEFLKTCL